MKNDKWRLMPLLMILAAGLLLAGCTQQATTPEPEAAGDEAAEAAGDAYEPDDWAAGGQTGAPAAQKPASRPASRPAAAAQPATGQAPAPAPETPAPAPAVAQAPAAREMLTLPTGKRIKITLDGAISSENSRVGDRFTGTVSKTVHLQEGSIVAVRKGSRIEGTVTEVEPAKRAKGIARLGLRFDELVLDDGSRVPITAGLVSEAESTKKRDAATIAGGAAAGAVLGRIIGKDGKDALIGAVAGGAIGTAVVLGTKNNEVELQAGTPLTLELEQPVKVPAGA